jgi:rhamnosyltransferase
MKASVIIPVYNGLPKFKPVLASVLNQSANWEYEVMVVDSGSTDGSWEFCEKCAARDRRLQLIAIHPKDFGHGRTRNLAISRTRGEFIAVITQDSQPFNEMWLATLVDSLAACTVAWGAFGQHIAWPESNPVIKHMIKAHFDGCSDMVALRQVPAGSFFERCEEERQRLHFFSDNNACLRRAAWIQQPYPEVNFGEDQLWAKEVLTKGGGILYVHNAAVYHSHDYGMIDTFYRTREEAKYFYTQFNYNIAGGYVKAPLRLLYRIHNEWKILRKEGGLKSNFWHYNKSIYNNIARMAGAYCGITEAKLAASNAS